MPMHSNAPGQPAAAVLPVPQPVLTVVGGQPVHDPEGLMRSESLGSSR
jgi:hypothetical protein